MSLLHVSIAVDGPERVARFLSLLMGGRALPFPPFPNCWIAFTEADDGSAIEVYPLTHTLRAGDEQVAIKSSMSEAGIVEVARAEGRPARTYNRGPFHCVEIWLENRLLVEVLDPAMQRSCERGMTVQNWGQVFGLE